MRKVLILTDGKAGHENQSKAFACALGCNYDLIDVRFKSKFHKMLSYLFDHLGIRTFSLLKSSDRTIEHSKDYAAVLGTGSGTFYAAKVLAWKFGVKCGVVLYPRGYDISSFDCILAPVFDKPAKALNVIEIPANLVAADEAFYENGVASFLKKIGVDGSEGMECAVAVIIGGPNKCSTMSVDWMKSQLDIVFKSNNQSMDQSRKCQFWVTTSRRTPADIETLVDSYPWDFKLIYSKDHFNPIPAFVKLARKIYVTAESTGMLSEACTFGTAEVVALDNLNPGPHKFRRFVEGLRANGYVDGARKIKLASQFAAARRLMGF